MIAGQLGGKLMAIDKRAQDYDKLRGAMIQDGTEKFDRNLVARQHIAP